MVWLAILVLASVLVTWSAIGWIGPTDGRQALSVGVMWLLLTLAFEFLVSHYAFRTPWRRSWRTTT
jgi:hypothetical protein